MTHQNGSEFFSSLVDKLQAPGISLKQSFMRAFKDYIKRGAKAKEMGLRASIELGCPEDKIKMTTTRVKVIMIPCREVSALEASIVASYISKGLITQSLFEDLLKEICMQNLSLGELKCFEGGDSEKLLIVKGDTSILIEN